MSLVPFVALVTHRFSTKTRRGFNDQRHPMVERSRFSADSASGPRVVGHSLYRTSNRSNTVSMSGSNASPIVGKNRSKNSVWSASQVCRVRSPSPSSQRTHRRRTTTGRHVRQSYGARPAPGLDHPSRWTTRLEPAARSDPVRDRPAPQLSHAWVRRSQVRGARRPAPGCRRRVRRQMATRSMDRQLLWRRRASRTLRPPTSIGGSGVATPSMLGATTRRRVSWRRAVGSRRGRRNRPSRRV